MNYVCTTWFFLGCAYVIPKKNLMIKLDITEKGGIFHLRSQAVVMRALTSAMYEVTSFLEKEVKERVPVGFHGNRGAGLKQTIWGKPIFKGTAIVKGVISHTSKYGDVIELGRRPNKKMPPAGSLIDWIVFKFAGFDEEDAWDIEWAVRRNIGKFGFKGAFMFKNAYEDNEDKIFDIFDQAGFNIAKTMTKTGV